MLNTVRTTENTLVPARFLVLYGSQTGVSRSIAERLALQARHLFVPLVSTGNGTSSSLTLSLSALDSYLPISRLAKEKGIVLFVCSTTGYGVPPDNMCQFWRRLMNRSLPIGCALPNLHFAVLGIGDSSYPKFNVVAKKLYRRLTQLGATPLELSTADDDFASEQGLGLADEQADLTLHGLLRWWVPQLWELLSKNWQLPFVTTLPKPLTLPVLESPAVVASFWPIFNVEFVTHSAPLINGVCTTELEGEQVTRAVEEDNSCILNGLPSPLSAKWFCVKQNQRVTASDHFQDTRLLTLSVDHDQPNLKFQPGDVLFVQPKNRLEDVVLLLTVTCSSPRDRLRVTTRDPNFPAPSVWHPVLQSVSRSGLTTAWYATYYFDLTTVPDSFVFAKLAACAYLALQKPGAGHPKFDTDRLKLEFERLAELGSMSSAEIVDDLHEYVTRPHRRLVEVLLDFPVTAGLLSPDKWFDVLPGPIRARPYSIASSPPDIQLLVAVVTYKTRMAKPRLGLTSNYLADLSVGKCLPGWIASDVAGGFNFAKLLKTPVAPCLLIAPGTGVAPFRSFLWYQHQLLHGQGNNVLFFGCRYSTKDYYFQKEWSQLESAGQLRVITAFSRESKTESTDNTTSQNTTLSRVYVQHKLCENADLVWSILANPDSFVFVAGNAKSMPNEVRNALVTVCETVGGLTAEEAEAKLTALEVDRRFQVEAWS
ncbi:hypothetical protein EG68_10147 [Paragonimus skrjabini miyazakii]|uniref:NADPH-dependent diflavin oxidoreductase 1 n=1 Tax=Paragonimus skrjabini miyazakii TaxID=59628 RepID=A0A8S9YPS6_9TREM|nr:hypothetical protein EG68_10147 [Paragonimus skrjabini miyazakii]